MPAYVTPAEVQGVAPSAAPGSPAPDPRLDEVISALNERVDAFNGQFAGTGYTGAHEIQESDYSYRRGSCVIAVPRMLTVDSVEEFKGGSWEAIPQDRYSTGLHFRQKWSSGIDTIYWDGRPSLNRLRVNGQIGFGHGAEGSEFDDDPVPDRLKFEFKKQARYDAARAGIGGKSGMEMYSGELVVEMGTWLYLQSAYQTFKEFRDPRRLFG